MKYWRDFSLLAAAGALVFTLSPVTVLAIPEGSPDPSQPPVHGQDRDAGEVVDGIKIPADRHILVINPFYLTSEEAGEIQNALKAADSEVSQVECEDESGKVKVTYTNGDPKETEIKKLVDKGFIKYKTSKYDTVGAAAPALPTFYNSGKYCTLQNNPRYEAGAVALFRDDYAGKAKVSMKLENNPGLARAAGDMVVFANSVGQVALDSTGNPDVDFKDDGQEVTDKGGLGGFKIRWHEYDRPENMRNQAALTTREIDKVPAENFKPYKFYTLATTATANERIARDARLGKHEVTYTIHRKGDENDKLTGVVNIRVLPLKEKFEPVVTNNSKTNPLDLGQLQDRLPWNKIAGAIGFDVVDGANSVREQEPVCNLGGKEPSCYKLSPSKRLDRLENIDSLSIRRVDDSQTRANLKETKFEVDRDITSTEPGLPNGVHKIRVKAIYPDNQTDPEYAKYNADGDSVDYFEIYVKANTYTTHKPKLTVIPPNTTTLDEIDKQRVREAIRRANPGRGLSDDRIVFDPDGNATVTFPNGNTEKIERADLVKELNPPALTKVVNRHNLRADEKTQVEQAIRDANGPTANNLISPANKIVVNPDGEAEVTIPGRDKPAAFLPKQTVIQLPELTRVANKGALEEVEKKAVAEAIAKANGHLFDEIQGAPTDGADGAKIFSTKNGAQITVKKDGGVEVQIPNEKNPNSPQVINFSQPETVVQLTPPLLTPVKDRNNLSSEEKTKINEAIKTANAGNDDLVTAGAKADEITVKSSGETTVTLKNRDPQREFKFAPPETVIQLPELTRVKDPNSLEEADQRAVVNKIRKANPHLGLQSPIDDTKTSVDSQGTRTFVLQNGSKITVAKNGDTKVEVKAGSVANLTQNQTVEFKQKQTVIRLNAPKLTVVGNHENLTGTEQDQVEKAVQDSNPKKPGAESVAGVYPKTNGDTVVVLEDGRKFIFYNPETVIDRPELTPVKDKSRLTPDEIDKVLEKAKLTNERLGDKVKKTETVDRAKRVTLENGIKIQVAPHGEVTITIPSETTGGTPQEITFTPPQTVIQVPELTEVSNKNSLTPGEGQEVVAAVQKANPDILGNTPGQTAVSPEGTTFVTFPNGATVSVKSDGVTTVTLPDGREVGFTQNQTVREVGKTPDTPLMSAVPDAAGSDAGGSGGGTGAGNGGFSGFGGFGGFEGFGGTPETPAPSSQSSASGKPQPTPSQPTQPGTPSPQPQSPQGQSPQPQSPQGQRLKDPQPTPVRNAKNLTPAEKQQVRAAVKHANPNLGLSDDQIQIADDGWITVHLPDGSVVRIPPVKGVSEYAPPGAQSGGAVPGAHPALSGSRVRLPRTGVSVWPLLGAAFACVAVGATLVLRSRRCRRRSDS